MWLREHDERGVEDCKRQRLGMAIDKQVSSEYTKVATLTSSKFFWLPSQELHKIKPVKIQA